jgi:hypothetical protein
LQNEIQCYYNLYIQSSDILHNILPYFLTICGFCIEGPGPPKSLKVASDNLYENSFLLQWEGPDQGNVDEYCFTLSNDTHINQTENCISSSETNVTFKDLIEGTSYTVNITSKWNSLTSNSYKWIRQYTSNDLYILSYFHFFLNS